MDGPRIPTATYRLQINSGFPLHRARAVVPYLHRLGISDLYASPIFFNHRNDDAPNVCDFDESDSGLCWPRGRDAR